MIFHRINGYIVILLVLASNAGALMIARRSFGGTLATQTAIGLLAIMSTASVSLSYYNIKRLQIDQHRAWMLRAWFYVRLPLSPSHYFQSPELSTHVKAVDQFLPFYHLVSVRPY